MALKPVQMITNDRNCYETSHFRYIIGDRLVRALFSQDPEEKSRRYDAFVEQLNLRQ